MRQPAVELRQLASEDAPRMVEWMLDPSVADNIGLVRAPSLGYTHEFIARAGSDDVSYARAIVFEGRHVGNVVLDRIDRPGARARMSIYLGERAARGRGVGAAALRAILRAGFRELELDEIWLTVFPENAPAVRIYRQAGFEYAPERESELDPDRPAGTVAMVLARDRFEGATP